MPLLIVPMRRSPASASPTSSSSSARSAAPPSELRELLVQLEQLVARAPVGEAEQLGEVAELRGAASIEPAGAPHTVGGPGGRA